MLKDAAVEGFFRQSPAFSDRRKNLFYRARSLRSGEPGPQTPREMVGVECEENDLRAEATKRRLDVQQFLPVLTVLRLICEHV